jgi:hypothetical protein
MSHNGSSRLMDAEYALNAMMECGPAMTGNHQFTDARPLADARGNGGICDKMLVGLVLCTLVRAADAIAGEQAPIAAASVAPEMSELRPSPTADASALPLPAAFEPRDAPDAKAYSTTDFTPRRPSVFDAEPIANSSDEAPMLRGTTVWQRLSEYRVHDRVRLLTLWQSGASTVSLQAGKRGSPSLQWTSRLLNRGEVTHGLLDRLFSVRFAGAGSAQHSTARAAALPAISKPVNLSAVGGAPGYPPSASRP